MYAVEIGVGVERGEMGWMRGDVSSGKGYSRNACSRNRCSGKGCSRKECSGNGCSGNRSRIRKGSNGNGCRGNVSSRKGCSGADVVGISAVGTAVVGREDVVGL
jgi:hypothetical protein